MITTMVLLCCFGAATIGGAFFAFSVFIMESLARLPANQGIAAMQSINIVVLESRFISVFIATASLSVACMIVAWFSWSEPGSLLLLSAGVFYVVGTALVTIAFNIPKNEKLEPMDPESQEAAAYWPQYVREWTFWNSVRTVAALVSAVCGVMAVLR